MRTLLLRRVLMLVAALAAVRGRPRAAAEVPWPAAGGWCFQLMRALLLRHVLTLAAALAAALVADLVPLPRFLGPLLAVGASN